MKKFVSLLLAMLMVLSLVACGGDGGQSNTNSGDKVIKIGVFEPLSGDSASGGKKEMLGMQFASLLGGSVITEQVFAWPGVGRLVIQSITTSDFAVVECIVFLMAVIFVVINFIVDVLYCVINPRVRLQ